MYELICRARNGEDDPWMRRRLEAGPDQRNFPILEEFFAQGATDYFAQLFTFGENGDPSQGTGVVYSFASDRRGGFDDNDTALLRATLPGLSLAMKAHAGHVIASALLQTYLGEQTGRRVHAGAIERGSVESLHAVLWFADIRGFTPTSDASPGPVVIELLNSVFEVIAATLRSRGGEVLKFLGDGDLATLSFKEADRARTCQNALDAAAETMRSLEMLNATRAASGVPTVTVDIALHIGEVLCGNVGATDRLDFTVIGPAVNEVTRIEALCEPLHSTVLVSAEFAAALGNAGDRLVSLGRHRLRGIREAKEIFTPAPSPIS
jgi:adenylate cyclase